MRFLFVRAVHVLNFLVVFRLAGFSLDVEPAFFFFTYSLHILNHHPPASGLPPSEGHLSAISFLAPSFLAFPCMLVRCLGLQYIGKRSCLYA